MIDLGREQKALPCCEPPSGKKEEKRICYPSLYVSDVEELDLPLGEVEFHAVGKVVSVTKRDDKNGSCCSIEIEVHKLEPMAKRKSSGLAESLDKIAAKKTRYDEDEE